MKWMQKLSSTLLLIFLVTTVMAQSAAKSDVILKMNGDELSGKVIEMNDTEIKFTYAGETLVYTIKKIDILKITYASGRIEVINKQPLPSAGQTEQQAQAAAPATNGNLESHHNKVAILPFSYLKDGELTADVLSEKVQTEAYSYLTKHAGLFAILDPRTTNALLIKAGVNKDNIKGYTMEDLCNLLGVEYVVEGIVSVNKGTQTNYQSNSGNVKTSSNNSKSNNGKTTYSGSSSGSTMQNYETTLNLNVYNDKGNSVYSQERRSFWSSQDAYKMTLEYLLKRTPLYSK